MILLLSFLLKCSSASHTYAAGADRHFSSASADGDAQISISDIAEHDQQLISDLENALKLAPVIDITDSFDSSKLVTDVRSLVPLRLSSPDQAPQAGYLTKNPKAYVASATIWDPDNSNAQRGLSGRLNISVCWLNPSGAYQRTMRLTRAAVTATWEYYGNVSFVGWNKCDEQATGVKILISDERPQSVYGRYANSKSRSMILNFTFSKERIDDCQNRADTCIYSIAVHEFGHALGFLHEQELA